MPGCLGLVGPGMVDQEDTEKEIAVEIREKSVHPWKPSSFKLLGVSSIHGEESISSSF